MYITILSQPNWHQKWCFFWYFGADLINEFTPNSPIRRCSSGTIFCNNDAKFVLNIMHFVLNTAIKGTFYTLIYSTGENAIKMPE